MEPEKQDGLEQWRVRFANGFMAEFFADSLESAIVGARFEATQRKLRFDAMGAPIEQDDWKIVSVRRCFTIRLDGKIRVKCWE